MPYSEGHIHFDTQSVALKLSFCIVLPVIKAQLLWKAVPDELVSLGLGQARPIRSAHGEHPAAAQRKARARPQWSRSERSPCAPRGGPETSEHDGVSCHKGEALISNTLFAVKEVAVLAPGSIWDALYVVFIWEGVLVWWWCGRWESCGPEGMHRWVLTFIKRCTPKKHLFLNPSKWLGTVLLDYDGDKPCWGGETAKSGWRWWTLAGITSLSPVCEQQGEEMEACEELALALSRGLQLDTQRSSRDSLQCSSGYSTQTTTPCCSEDTIPSQGTHPTDVRF